jgi:O-succinylhomoserine sulfhydrylase
MSESFDFETRAVRAGTERTSFLEHSEALFLTSSFVFENAAQAAARFSGAEPGYVYSRFSNPTVSMFERRLASLEGAEDCLATASGMAAITATSLAILKAGDHVLCAANVFGADGATVFQRVRALRIDVTYVRAGDPDAWRSAARDRTRMLYCETPSNPLMEIVDMRALGELGRALGAVSVVDNCFCTPVLQRPARAWRRSGDPFGDQVPGRPGDAFSAAQCWDPARSYAISSCRCCEPAGPVCRRSTRGYC